MALAPDADVAASSGIAGVSRVPVGSPYRSRWGHCSQPPMAAQSGGAAAPALGGSRSIAQPIRQRGANCLRHRRMCGGGLRLYRLRAIDGIRARAAVVSCASGGQSILGSPAPGEGGNGHRSIRLSPGIVALGPGTALGMRSRPRRCAGPCARIAIREGPGRGTTWRAFVRSFRIRVDRATGDDVLRKQPCTQAKEFDCPPASAVGPRRCGRRPRRGVWSTGTVRANRIPHRRRTDGGADAVNARRDGGAAALVHRIARPGAAARRLSPAKRRPCTVDVGRGW